MADILFLLAFFLPPAVIVAGALALWLGSTPRRSEASAPLRAQHA